MYKERIKQQCIRSTIGVTISCCLFSVSTTNAQEWSPQPEQVLEKKSDYSPYVTQRFPRQVFFGDTHHHSSYSFDSGMFGNTLGPEESFRFARGEAVTVSNGTAAKLIRPLDFLAVTDHAAYLGFTDLIKSADPRLMATKGGREMVEGYKAGGEKAWLFVVSMMKDFDVGKPRFEDPLLNRNIWEDVVDIASRFNEPGKFTAFNGYEWTPAPDGNNLHRVVIFRDGPERAKQIVPFSAFDSPKPELLWKFLADYQKKTGGQALAIPHNPNISNGLMFAERMSNGKLMNSAYAKMRSRWEPLLEVTQAKGDSESHPALSPDDEFSDFETWDFGNAGSPTTPKKKSMLQYEYARSALKWGLKHQQKLGANPFKFGLVGGTDSHVSISTTREENFFGKLPSLLPGPKRTKEAIVMKADKSPAVYSWQTSASGLTAVWAEENTRKSLFDAMMRREVYATTGTRIRVRVFGGWDFAPPEVQRPDFARQGYSRGVPMGGDLTKGPKGKAPNFMVRAVRDPDGANLDRVQIIKGWVTSKGEMRERIYDVAVSGDRKIDENGRCKQSVGNTVDIKGATYTNSIGDAVLMAHWEDPEFDPRERAFYYVRVIEIPTPRWTAYDAARFGIKMSDKIAMTIQDRAYTSPIWYTP
ncbi:MAG: DUF3604 domain-containing protein [Hyphomicrobiaceae bacterium]